MKSNLQRLTVPALTGGISTQPEGQRYPNQTSESINVNLDMVRGLEKRDGTKLESVLQLGGTPLGTVTSIHWIDRDDDEIYVVVATDTGLRVFNILDGGVECGLTVDPAVDATYISNLTGMRTIADTSYLFNDTVPVEMDPTVASGYDRVNTTAVPTWSDLTAPTALGEYRLVEQDEPAHPAGFYEGIGLGPDLPLWERVRTPEANSLYLATTMPVRLRNTAKNTFTLDNPEWTGRLDGDSETNPPATFVGRKITGIEYFAGRLWIQAGQQVVGSRTEDILNFWINDDRNLNDADPIDLSVGSDSAEGITHISTYSNTMLVFTGDSRQYEIASGTSGVVSPATISLRETTAYPNPTCEPVRLGSYLYFSTNGGGSSRVYEYILTDGSIPSSASDVISHTFGYIPDDVEQMVSLSQTDQIFLKASSSEDIFVYQQMFASQQKVQNAVFKWQVAGDGDEVVSMTGKDSTLYLVLKRGEQYRVESIYTARSSDAINQDDFDYPISLDGKEVLSGTYDSLTGLTTWVTEQPSSDISLGVLGSGWKDFPVYSRVSASSVAVDRSGGFVEVNRPTANTLTIAGDYSYAPVIFGRTVNMLVQLSQLYVRDDAGTPVMGTLQLKRLNVYYRNTGFFRVGITPPARAKRERVFTSKQVGIFAFATNDNLIEGNGEFPVKVMSSAAGVKIELSSDNPAPCNIPYIETLGGFVPSKTSTTNYR